MKVKKLVEEYCAREQELKEEIEARKEKLYQDIAALKAVSQKDIDYLYWETELSTERVAVALQLNKPLSKAASKNHVVKSECQECGSAIETVIKSRTKLKELRKGKDCLPGRCEDCREKDREAIAMAQATYRVVNRILKTMPYKDYLETNHWQEFRKRALSRAGYRCQLCNGKKPLHVHHRTYENRGEERYQDVIVLCADCHKKFHK